MSGTRIKDFFDTAEEFEEMLEEAEEVAEGRGAIFIDELASKYVDYGMATFMTQGQYNWLKTIAEG